MTPRVKQYIVEKILKASVIIPTFNRANMVVDAIDSLCLQSYPADEYEIIVVDNNSSDGTKAKVETAIYAHPGHHIKYFLEKRQGDMFARNRGAKEAIGDILIFSDDDALFDQDYLSTILHLFDVYPTVGVVGTRISIKWEGGKPARWIKPYEYLLGALSYGNVGYVIKSNGLYVNNGSLAIKKDLYVSLGGINPAQIGDTIIGNAEGGFMKKIHQKQIPVAFSDDATMWHRQIVGKNDTVKDIRRRVENWGISLAYSDVFEHGKGEKRSIALPGVKMLWYLVTLRRRKALRQYFLLCENRKYNEYIWRYQHDPQLLALLKENVFEW